MTAFLRKFGLLSVLGGLVLAGPALAEKAPASIPAKLIVEDNAKLFSEEALNKAKKTIADHKGLVEREVHLETYARLSDADQKRYDAVKADTAKREQFWLEWTKAKASGERGLVIAINYEPGHVSIIASDEMAKSFGRDQRDEVQKRLVAKLREARNKPDAERTKLHDEGLAAAMTYVGDHIPASYGTTPRTTGRNQQAQHNADGGDAPPRKAGWGIGSWICLLISIGLGVWLVTALIRAFTGAMGGGGYGGGMGGGMGGGGFFPSLLGGLFGAAAGMWMYDQMFGGGSSAAHAGDGGGGDYGGGGDAVQDQGNFSDENYSGGDVDGGDAGGGDGGGGDFGGGDFYGGDGGGGGDFGGGDF
jgi:hypothetical protein